MSAHTDFLTKTKQSNMNQLTKSQIIQIEAAIGRCKKEIAEISGKDVDITYYIKADKLQEVSPDEIVDIVCEHLAINVEDIYKKTRKRDISYARHLCVTLCLEYCKLSLGQLGRYFGGRDHSTMIHSRDSFYDMVSIYEDNRRDYEIVKSRINSRLIAQEI